MRFAGSSEIEGIRVHVLVLKLMDRVAYIVHRGRMACDVGSFRLSRVKQLRWDLLRRYDLCFLLLSSRVDYRRVLESAETVRTTQTRLAILF